MSVDPTAPENIPADPVDENQEPIIDMAEVNAYVAKLKGVKPEAKVEEKAVETPKTEKPAEVKPETPSIPDWLARRAADYRLDPRQYKSVEDLHTAIDAADRSHRQIAKERQEQAQRQTPPPEVDDEDFWSELEIADGDKKRKATKDDLDPVFQKVISKQKKELETLKRELAKMSGFIQERVQESARNKFDKLLDETLPEYVEHIGTGSQTVNTPHFDGRAKIYQAAHAEMQAYHDLGITLDIKDALKTAAKRIWGEKQAKEPEKPVEKPTPARDQKGQFTPTARPSAREKEVPNSKAKAAAFLRSQEVQAVLAGGNDYHGADDD